MSRDGALVSIVMPVWRPRADWLREAVQSVLDQRGCEIELIVVDDGNPVPVADLLDWVDDARLRCIRTEHGGPAHARNVGLRAARGRQIRFVDADDVLEVGSTARLQGLIGDADDIIAYGGTLVCDEQLRGHRRIESTLEGSIAEQCLLGGFDTRHVSLLYPRAVVDRAGEWDTEFQIGEDWDFVLRALEHGRARRDPAIATFYRRHGQSMTGSVRAGAGEAAALRVIARYIGRHPYQTGSALHNRAVAAVLLNRARALEAFGDFGSAFRRMAVAARYDPRRASRAAAGLLTRRVKTIVKSADHPTP